MPPYVPPEGPRDAHIVLVGEGPGREEILKGRPFVGSTGQQLDDLLRNLGIARHEIYITNVEKRSLDKPVGHRMVECVRELVREFEGLTQPRVFVPLGNYALQALSGWQQGVEGSGISLWRGSILPTFFGAKMVPTMHPAWYMRGEWRYKGVVLADLQRALEQSEFPEIRRPARKFHIEPTYADAIEWLARLEQAEYLAVDIETFGWGWNSTYVACIGFAPTPHEAFCIPIMRNGRAPYWTHDQERGIWRALSRVLVAPSKKVFQNGMFDIPVLNQHWLKVKNFWHDTMLAHHLIAPELPHGLDFIASVYTEEPYYKEEGKNWNHNMPLHQLWTYNCKDVCVTLEAAHALELELAEMNMQTYFHSYVMPLTWPLMEMQRVGIRVDKDRLDRLKLWLEAENAWLQEDLERRVGQKINVKSPKDMAALLETLGVRATRLTPTGKPKLDEESIREYARQAKYKGRDISLIDQALRIREKRTLLSNFVDIQTDEDNMYHFSLLIHGTKPGRLSARAPRDRNDNPLGPQMQNVPYECRGIFAAAPGKVFLSGDLKQAEAMYVAWDAQDAKMIEIFTSRQDIHRFNAMNVFRVEQKDVDKVKRDIAKRIVHGFDYGMSPRRAVGVLCKDGFYVSEAEMKVAQQAYFAACPRVLHWQRNVCEIVRLTKQLKDPFGRVRVFRGLYDDHMEREALAQNPQSAIAYITNTGIIRLYEWLDDESRVVLQVHDEILVETPEDRWQETARLMARAMTTPMILHGRELTIPVEIKMGKFWATDMKEVNVEQLMQEGT